MNKADICNGKNIEDGDFVVVDANQRNPESGQRSTDPGHFQR